jgi:hypothetical protein
MAGYRVEYTLATKLVNDLVEAADGEQPAKTIARDDRVGDGYGITPASSSSASAAAEAFGRESTISAHRRASRSTDLLRLAGARGELLLGPGGEHERGLRIRPGPPAAPARGARAGPVPRRPAS